MMEYTLLLMSGLIIGVALMTLKSLEGHLKRANRAFRGLEKGVRRLSLDLDSSQKALKDITDKLARIEKSLAKSKQQKVFED